MIDFLSNEPTGDLKIFSIDVVDLFYSLPTEGVLQSVRDCIEDSGLVAFQNNCGVHVQGFLDLLRFYLQSTVFAFDGNMFRQRKGICIGSCIAPVLSDMFWLDVIGGFNKILAF